MNEWLKVRKTHHLQPVWLRQEIMDVKSKAGKYQFPVILWK